MTREEWIEFFEEPKKNGGIYYVILSVVIVYLSLILLAYEQKNWPLNPLQSTVVSYLDTGVLLFFSIDFLARIIILKNRYRYIKSIGGLIDLLSILPALLAIFFPVLPSTEWLRVLRLFRFFRILKFFRSPSRSGMLLGLFSSLLPWLGIAASIKLGIVILLEDKSFWIETNSLDIPISVIGFATAILLGAKLSTAQNRFYSVEDAICRIVGGLRGLRAEERLKELTNEWARGFTNELKSSRISWEVTLHNYEELAITAKKINYDDSVLCDLGKDMQYVMHLVNSRTPLFFDTFMKIAASIFIGMSVIAVPSFTGLVTTLLMVTIVGGMYVLIDDLDEPIAKSNHSLINVNISPLQEFISIKNQ